MESHKVVLTVFDSFSPMLRSPEGILIGMSLGIIGMSYFGDRLRKSTENDCASKISRGINVCMGLACMIVGGFSGPTIEYLIRWTMVILPARSYMLFLAGIAFWCLVAGKKV